EDGELEVASGRSKRAQLRLAARVEARDRRLDGWSELLEANGARNIPLGVLNPLIIWKIGTQDGQRRLLEFGHRLEQSANVGDHRPVTVENKQVIAVGDHNGVGRLDGQFSERRRPG